MADFVGAKRRIERESEGAMSRLSIDVGILTIAEASG